MGALLHTMDNKHAHQAYVSAQSAVKCTCTALVTAAHPMELALGRADSAWTPSSTMPCTRAKSDSRATTMDACRSHQQRQVAACSPACLNVSCAHGCLTMHMARGHTTLHLVNSVDAQPDQLQLLLQQTVAQRQTWQALLQRCSEVLHHHTSRGNAPARRGPGAPAAHARIGCAGRRRAPA